jgi:hypothetical protein
VGLAYSFIYWQFRCCHGEFAAPGAITAFLPHPVLYWPWLVIGAAIGMLAFYLMRLLK